MSKDYETASPGGQFLVYQTEDGKLKIDVRFEGETVWLTQQHMAELFQTTQQNISVRQLTRNPCQFVRRVRGSSDVKWISTIWTPSFPSATG
jgi:hypothetical protein